MRLSGVVVLGLIAQLLIPGWRCVDSVTLPAIVVFLVEEGRGTWVGEEGESDSSRQGRTTGRVGCSHPPRM
jgi:hypothetical protein